MLECWSSAPPRFFEVPAFLSGAGSLPVVLQERRVGQGASGNYTDSYRYVWGPNGLVVAEGPQGALVPALDGLGSVRALTDSGRQVVQTRQTDAWGVPTRTEGGGAPAVRLHWGGAGRGGLATSDPLVPSG